MESRAAFTTFGAVTVVVVAASVLRGPDTGTPSVAPDRDRGIHLGSVPRRRLAPTRSGRSRDASPWSAATRLLFAPSSLPSASSDANALTALASVVDSAPLGILTGLYHRGTRHLIPRRLHSRALVYLQLSPSRALNSAGPSRHLCSSNDRRWAYRHRDDSAVFLLLGSTDRRGEASSNRRLRQPAPTASPRRSSARRHPGVSHRPPVRSSSIRPFRIWIRVDRAVFGRFTCPLDETLRSSLLLRSGRSPQHHRIPRRIPSPQPVLQSLGLHSTGVQPLVGPVDLVSSGTTRVHSRRPAASTGGGGTPTPPQVFAAR